MSDSIFVNKIINRVPHDLRLQFCKTCEKYEINKSPERLAHFLAQVEHESSSFKTLEENLNYSAKRLLVVFPKYFKDEATANKYHRKKEAIANRVYANRMGNGDEQSGDGYRFRGRGTIQLTGRENYTLFFKSIGEPLQEDRVSKDLAIQSAGWFWDTKNINEKIDRGADVVAVTKIVNGGRNGLADRMKKTQEILSVITS